MPFGKPWRNRVSISTAKQLGLGLCPKCHKVNKMHSAKQCCSRCHSSFHQRKPNSLKLTMAWTVTAIIFLFPANLLPMMVINTLGDRDASTILGGIDYFINDGVYPVAIIVFVASFLIPLAKIAGLILLMMSVKKGSKLTVAQRARLFHFIEFLGPWSMLDVFVVALMVAVVNLGFITSIEAGTGSTYFTLMVIFTMLAAQSFDPRLLWDVPEDEQ